MEQASLYIHIPFCLSKCPYCAFVSSPCDDQGPPASYLQALRSQVSQLAKHPWSKERVFASLFVGGGTPTVYAGEELAALVELCLKAFPFVDKPEISIEANPNTVSKQKLSRLREAGVNRLSIGVQSFSDRFLKVAGRTHSSSDASKAFEHARNAGFDNINLDFIYGLPRQTTEDLLRTLETAVSHKPEHLALYEMTIEPETPFAQMAERGKLNLPKHDEVAEMERLSQTQLRAAGYGRYEISNYSRPGKECRHNINYWKNGSYLGIGASAVSSFDGFRVKNVANYNQYVRCVERGVLPFQEGEGLSVEASFRESVITGLRMTSGVSVSQLRNKYGLDLQKYYGKIIARFVEEDMLHFDNEMMRLTEKSLPVANQVLAELV